MAKKDWGKPGYRGKPDPLKPANRFMLVLIGLLILGFLQAGFKQGWFTEISSYFY